MKIQTNPTLSGLHPDEAMFSDDETLRYLLTREIGPGSRPLVACGLNPSTATAFKNDPTIRKEIGFAQRWGCSRLVKANAYAYRATLHADMKRARKSGVDVVGPENDRIIRELVDLCIKHDGIFLVCWGTNIEPDRQKTLSEIIGPIAQCLLVNQDGSPGHPLYIPYETPLQPWAPPTIH